MEHTVTGIRDMHFPLMDLTVGVCQPEQDCALCTTNRVHERWTMGLDVRHVYCSEFFPLLASYADFQAYNI
jgi:hypothetical protein